MRITRVAAAMLLVAPFSDSAAQKMAVVAGKVVSQTGQNVQGANVYINDRMASVKTGADGMYALIVPLNQDSKDPASVNLRVRALGFVPAVQAVRLTEGTQNVNFVLKSDPNEPIIVVDGVVQSNDRGERPVPAMRGQQPMPPGDPFARFLFSPEEIMKHQSELQLSDAQRSTLQEAIGETQKRVIQTQWVLAAEGEKLTKMLDTSAVNEQAVLAQIDRIIGVEREMKRAQMTLMIRIKNALTPAQQAQLRDLR